MKRYLLGISIIIFICSLTISSAASNTLQTGLNLDMWESNSHIRGRQVYIPISIESQYEELSFSLLTGYANSNYSNPSYNQKRSLDAWLDTKVNLSYELVDYLPIDAIIGLDLNLPTGKRNPDPAQLFLYTNPDLFSVKGNGEGFNINPTLSLAKGWENWMAGLGFGYLWTGSYNYSSEIKDYDPGDIFNLFAEIQYDLSANWQVRTFGNYAYYDKARVQRQEFYQEGEFFLLGLGLRYFQPKWDTDASLQAIERGKRKFPINLQGLSQEEKNSLGNEWVLALSLRYYINEKTTFRYLAEYLRLNANAYPSSSPLFIEKREKFTGGFGIVSLLGENLEGEFEIKGFFLDEGKNWFHTNEEHYRGLSIKASIAKSF